LPSGNADLRTTDVSRLRNQGVFSFPIGLRHTEHECMVGRIGIALNNLEPRTGPKCLPGLARMGTPTGLTSRLQFQANFQTILAAIHQMLTNHKREDVE